MQAIHNLVSAEFDFCQTLNVGMEIYVKPLQTVLPETSYTKMFLSLPEVGTVYI